MSTGPISDRSHDRYRELIPAFRAGLLEPSGEDLLRRHLAECEDCRVLADDLSLEDDPDGPEAEHIPVEILARWPDAARAVRGLERALVRAHLERCRECREELELLGHAPVLDVDPALEPTGPALPVGTAEAQRGSTSAEDGHPARKKPGTGPTRPVVKIVMGGRYRGRSWSPVWTLGGWVTAAAAAVFAIVVRPALTPTVPLGPGPPVPGVVQNGPATRGADGEPSAPSAPSGRPAAAARLMIARVATLPITLRDADAAADTLLTTVIGPETRTLAIVPPDLPDLAAGAEVVVTLLAPSGAALGARQTTAAELRDPGAAIVFVGETTLRPGVYRLSIRARDPRAAGGGAEIEQAFRIQLGPH